MHYTPHRPPPITVNTSSRWSHWRQTGKPRWPPPVWSCSPLSFGLQYRIQISSCRLQQMKFNANYSSSLNCLRSRVWINGQGLYLSDNANVTSLHNAYKLMQYLLLLIKRKQVKFGCKSCHRLGECRFKARTNCLFNVHFQYL